MLDKSIYQAYLRDCLGVVWGESVRHSEIGRFSQNAWAIAHGFEHGGFGYVPKIAPNSLKRLKNA